MPRPLTAASLLVLAACAASAPAAPRVAPAPPVPAEVAELTALHERHRVEAIAARRFTHAELWAAIGPVIDASPRLTREEVGRSVEGRAIHLVRYGRGPVPVLLWSQMHGDESTATMALADLFRYLAEADDARTARLAERLTLWFVPMLNPDGAERFQRRNAQGIDVNRDARLLATPEGRVLRDLQRRLSPAFGFNLHDQNVRTTVEGTDRIAAFAFLAPPFDEARSDNPVRLRAARLAAVMRHAAEPLVGGHISRYDDTYNPRAFGDGMQRWGTSTVLVESGAWRDDPEKQFLRRVNFVAILAAVDAIAADTLDAVDPAGYRGLPFNGRSAFDLLVRGGTVVAPGMPPFRADVAVNFADPLGRLGGTLADVGDLDGASARDTVDAAGLFLHLPEAATAPGAGSIRTVRLGAPALLTARRDEAGRTPAAWVMEGGRIVERPGDRR